MAINTTVPGRPRVIAIIGGGFSGTVLAANLLRELPPLPTRLLLVERNARIGCGLAYAAHEFPYLLNVPVGRMAAVPEGAVNLLEFAQRRLPGITADTYLPRQLYGDYLREVLDTAQAATASGVQLDHLQGEATAIHALGTHGPLIVSVGTRQLLADQVVLACGDAPGVRKAYAAELADHPAYTRDPYADGWPEPSDRALLLIGSGLTMADIAVAAAERNPALTIMALSRHGLLPQSQVAAVSTDLRPPSQVISQSQVSSLAGLPLRALVRSVRALVRSVQAQGGDWRDVIGRMRDITPQLWRGLDETNRRRFLRHLRIFWDVHRHRMAPVTSERVAQLLRAGRLRIRAGRITQLCAVGRGVIALWRPRGRYDTQELWVDRVVECSGSDPRLEATPSALWRQLLGDGIATPDGLGLGLRTGRNGALIDIHGTASARLFYLGPMLRAAHWEATAVGELRAHAHALASALAAAGIAEGGRYIHMSQMGDQLTGLSREKH